MERENEPVTARSEGVVSFTAWKLEEEHNNVGKDKQTIETIADSGRLVIEVAEHEKQTAKRTKKTRPASAPSRKGEKKAPNVIKSERGRAASARQTIVLLGEQGIGKSPHLKLSRRAGRGSNPLLLQEDEKKDTQNVFKHQPLLAPTSPRRPLRPSSAAKRVSDRRNLTAKTGGQRPASAPVRRTIVAGSSSVAVKEGQGERESFVKSGRKELVHWFDGITAAAAQAVLAEAEGRKLLRGREGYDGGDLSVVSPRIKISERSKNMHQRPTTAQRLELTATFGMPIAPPFWPRVRRLRVNPPPRIKGAILGLPPRYGGRSYGGGMERQGDPWGK